MYVQKRALDVMMSERARSKMREIISFIRMQSIKQMLHIWLMY